MAKVTAEKALDLLLLENGDWYIWGAADCSQKVVDWWKAIGYAPYSGFKDAAADTMYDNFKTGKWKATRYKKGVMFALAFYGRLDNKDEHGVVRNATHVQVCLSENMAIGANGGGESVKTVAEAKRRDAKFKLSEINYRPDLIGIWLPDYQFVK